MDIKDIYQLYLKHPNVSTDTRKISQGCIFFALKGPNFNANEFASQAIAQGAAYAVIDDASLALNEKLILVKDVLNCLQQLAKMHRKNLATPLIAIAGSNGKTTTKELIASVLQQKYNVLYTPGNFNNHIGLPLTLLMLKKEHEIAVIEMGANHMGENAALCEIATPDYGIVTNNGKDHLEGFGSIEKVIESNSELYQYLATHQGIAIVNVHDNILMRESQNVKKRVTYAANTSERNARAEYEAQASQLIPQIHFTTDNSSSSIHSSLSGDYNFDNIMAAVVFGKIFHLQDDEIKAGIEKYVPANNRSQVIQTEHNRVFLDAYNANPSSMEAALKSFSKLTSKNKVVIVGDMFELGKFAHDEHKGILSLCKSLNFDRVFLVGEEFAKHDVGYHRFLKTDEAIEFFRENKLEGCEIFLKGSRGMKLERLMECF